MRGVPTRSISARGPLGLRAAGDQTEAARRFGGRRGSSRTPAGPKQPAWPAALPTAKPDPETQRHHFLLLLLLLSLLPLLPPPWAEAELRAAGLGVCGRGLAGGGGGGARGGCCSRCPRPRRPPWPPAGALLWPGRRGPPAAEVALRLGAGERVRECSPVRAGVCSSRPAAPLCVRPRRPGICG